MAISISNKKAMKKIFFLLTTGILFTCTNCVKTVESLYISEDEYQLINLNTYTNMNGIHFINKDLGFIVGDNGEVCKTKDGGISWNTKSLGDYYLRDVHFCNETNGYIVGTNEFVTINKDDDITRIGLSDVIGVVFRTMDGGESWEKTVIDDGGLYDKIFCLSNDSAVIIYSTHVAITKNGRNWEKKYFGYDTITINEDTILLPYNYGLADIYSQNENQVVALGYYKSIITTDFFDSWDSYEHTSLNISTLENGQRLSSDENKIYLQASDTKWGELHEVPNLEGVGDFYEIEDMEGVSDLFYYVIVNTRIHRTKDGGNEWETIIPREGKYSKLQKINGQYIYGLGKSTSYYSGKGSGQYLIKISIN